MIRRLAGFFVRLAQLYMPDPFLFAILLTAVAYAMAMGMTPHSPMALVGFWYDGLWKILSFAMQMILILLTGYALAMAPAVRRFLAWIAGFATTPENATVLVVLFSLFAALVNWGFALVVGALLAREVARRVPVDFPFLAAGAYSGFVLFASGLSSSVALISATEGSPMNVIAVQTGRKVTPISETLLAPYNLVLIAATLVLLPLLFRIIVPRPEESHPFRPSHAEPEPAAPAALPFAPTPAERMENSRVMSLLLAAFGIAYLVRHFYQKGFSLNIDLLVLIFLVAGLVLHRTPIEYVRAFNKAAHVAGPLALQYPLYGGIMGLMVESGLAALIAGWFVAVSTARTLPLWSFFSSVVISFFIPSGGAQWAVQGSFMIPAATKLGVSPSVTAMAVAFGDQAGNMLQPFWALPVIGIAGLGIRQIMGYCVMTFLLVATLSVLVLLLLA